MRRQIALGVFYFSVMVVITSWSYQVSEFHWVKSDNDEVMCGTSPPNKTLKAVISRVHCVSSCNHGCPSPPCQAINYWKNAQLCQQFYYRPCTYSVQQGCENYQVTTSELYIINYWNIPVGKYIFNWFLHRVRIARNAERCNSQRYSVCPSVHPSVGHVPVLCPESAAISSVCLSFCLSVYPSHSGIVSRRMTIRSCGFNLAGQSLLFLKR